VTWTLTLDPVIRHTVVHHSSTSTYIPNLLKSKKLFVDGRTYGRTFPPPPVILLGRLLEVDLKMKKHSERRKHCALAVVRRSQKFSPHHIPPSWGCATPKFNELEMVTTLTYKPSLMRIDAHNFELSW